jgi:hypothetical protein
MHRTSGSAFSHTCKINTKLEVVDVQNPGTQKKKARTANSNYQKHQENKIDKAASIAESQHVAAPVDKGIFRAVLWPNCGNHSAILTGQDCAFTGGNQAGGGVSHSLLQQCMELL